MSTTAPKRPNLGQSPRRQYRRDLVSKALGDPLPAPWRLVVAALRADGRLTDIRVTAYWITALR